MVNSRDGVRVVLIACKLLYTFSIVINFLFLLINIQQVLQFRDVSRHLVQTTFSSLMLLQGIFIFLLFKNILTTYDVWNKSSVTISLYLRKVAKGLVVVFLLQAFTLFITSILDPQYNKMSKEFYNSDSALVPWMRFIENNRDTLSAVTKFLDPRPIGTFALLLALVIFRYVKNIEKNNA